ncbi:MAG: hypothetical protein K9I82_03285 [Chitinophagaceae bacterium]|nr:hypothetical protein [Chitinophagaceae bacterium]
MPFLETITLLTIVKIKMENAAQDIQLEELEQFEDYLLQPPMLKKP